MLGPDNLRSWIFQQASAYWSFFALEPKSALCPSVIQLLPDNSWSYRTSGEPRSRIIDRYHVAPSRVLEIEIVSDQNGCSAFIPCPGEDGSFLINGQRYYAPFQRLVWDSSTDLPIEEYRRIDHVLLDGWHRRAVRSKRWTRDQDMEQAVTQGEAQDPPSKSRIPRSHINWKSSQDQTLALCGYLRKALLPYSSDSEPLLERLEDGAWVTLAKATQLKTYTVIPVKKKVKPCPGISCYEYIRSTAMYGEKIRRTPSGIDPVHTPEGDQIGLTRYLAIGTTISDDRILVPDDTPHFGLMAHCVPYARHDDPRRLLMACNMAIQAEAIDAPEVPAVLTRFERQLHTLNPKAQLTLGANLRVGFMFWKGYNYEDGIVVSESAAKKLRSKELRKVTIPIPSFCKLEEHAQPGDRVLEGDALARVTFSPMLLDLRLPAIPERLQRQELILPRELPWEDPSLLSSVAGIVTDARVIEMIEGVPPSLERTKERLELEVRIEHPLEIGDKLCNRHGNKGVVTAILPDKDMPKVGDEPLEILFNPIGVLNRGNYGQILEALHCWSSDASSRSGILDIEDPDSSVEDSASGSPLVASAVQQPNKPNTIRAVTGVNYILRLPHHAREKLTVFSTGKHSKITGQPPRGMAQKYGEMEIWALQAHGANKILSELCTERSRRVGPAALQQPILDHLAALGHEIVTDGDQVTLRKIPLESKPQEGKDLFGPAARTAKDSYCDAHGNTKEVPPLVTLFHRLSSEEFFKEHGPIYIDLGAMEKVRIVLKGDRRRKHSEVNESDAKRSKTEEPAFQYAGRYLFILAPQYRPKPPSGREHPTTYHYNSLVQELWRERTGSKAKRLRTSTEFLNTLMYNLLFLCHGKHGIFRRVGLSRRMDYSARLVIVPGPDLGVDTASLPWDVVRVLYRDLLLLRGIPEEILRTPQDQLNPEMVHQLVPSINDSLRSEWILLNRNPSLHKYSILSFHPRVHFDCYALRIPLLCTSPFGADFDGDQMTAVTIRNEASQNEAPKLNLAHNLFSVADGALVAPFGKDLLLGLSLLLADSIQRDALNVILLNQGLPEVTGQLTPSDLPMVLKTVMDLSKREDGTEPANLFLSLLSMASIHSLSGKQEQFVWGSLGDMRSLIKSFAGAAKDKFEEDQLLIQGMTQDELVSESKVRIDIMIHAKVVVGKFGGFLRRLYYRFMPSPASGLAFEGSLRSALESAQSITERATQRALSPKSGEGALRYEEFDIQLQDALSAPEGPQALQLSRKLGMDADLLADHLRRIGPILLEKPTGLLALLDSSRIREDDLERSTIQTDPRVKVFLS